MKRINNKVLFERELKKINRYVEKQLKSGIKFEFNIPSYNKRVSAKKLKQVRSLLRNAKKISANEIQESVFVDYTRYDKKKSDSDVRKFQKTINRLEHNGYVINIDKRFLKNLGSYDIKKIYSRASYIDKQTGELVQGKRPRQRVKDTEPEIEDLIDNYHVNKITGDVVPDYIDEYKAVATTFLNQLAIFADSNIVSGDFIGAQWFKNIIENKLSDIPLEDLGSALTRMTNMGYDFDFFSARYKNHAGVYLETFCNVLYELNLIDKSEYENLLNMAFEVQNSDE